MFTQKYPLDTFDKEPVMSFEGVLGPRAPLNPLFPAVSFTCDGEYPDNGDENDDAEIQVPLQGLLDEQSSCIQVHLQGK